MIKLTIALCFALISSISHATLYENAEDGNTNGWSVYDNTPAGATISNVYDENRQSSVIELNGDGWNNGYVLRKSSDGTAWNNTEETIIQWSMNYSERFLVYISVETIKGHRYIYYTPSNSNGGLSSNGRYIHHGLGSSSINGEWQTFTRDLEADLKEFESDNDIISVNAFLIRGNGKVDDIEMLKDKTNPVRASSIIEDYRSQIKSVTGIKRELDQLAQDARTKTKVSIFGATRDDGRSSRESEITGVKYYFSTSGKDSNDGLSPLKPKQTMKHMQIILRNLKPGDGILLKRGDVWKNYRSYTNVLKNLTGAKKIITCYGTGPRPKLSKYVEIRSSWIKESNGLWSTAYNGGEIGWLLIDSKAERVGLTLNDLIVKKDKLRWYYDENSKKLYLSVNPADKNIKVSGGHGLAFGTDSAHNLVIDNLDIEGANRGILIAATAIGVEITNCTLGKHSRFGIIISGQNNLIKNCIVDAHKPNFPNDDINYRARYGWEGIRVWGTKNSLEDEGNKIISCTVRDFEHGNLSTNSIKTDGDKSYNFVLQYNLSTGFNIFYGGRFSMAFNSGSLLFDNNLQVYTDQAQISGENVKITNNIVIQNKQSHLATASYNHGNGFVTNLQQLGLVNMLASGNVTYKLEGVPFVIKNKYNPRYGVVPVENNTIKDNLDIDSCTSPMVYSASPKDIFAHIDLDQKVNGTTLSGNIVHRSNGNQKVIYIGDEEHTPNLNKLLSFEEAQDGRVLDRDTDIYDNFIK